MKPATMVLEIKCIYYYGAKRVGCGYYLYVLYHVVAYRLAFRVDRRIILIWALGKFYTGKFNGV